MNEAVEIGTAEPELAAERAGRHATSSGGTALSFRAHQWLSRANGVALAGLGVGRYTERVPAKVRITAGSVSVLATLDDSQTARVIGDALPLDAKAETWGDEIFFSIPVTLPEEGAREVVERGDLGYWPPGRAFCIFFGPTPLSQAGEIRPASPVNVFGRVDGDATVFRPVRAGTRVRVEPAKTGDPNRRQR